MHRQDIVPRIRVGTASWTDPTLIRTRRFYPPSARSAEARLRHYTTRFPLVEVDSSYYALPSARNAQLWCERTPADFRFNVKAFRLMTGHAAFPEALPADMRAHVPPRERRRLYLQDLPGEWRDVLWDRFVAGVEPLKRAGRLGTLLFQFAPWVQCDARGCDWLTATRARLPDWPVAVEFRHRSWFEPDTRADTLALERELRFTHVVVDEPQGADNSVPQVWEETTPSLAVVRLHGRNVASWNAPRLQASSDRFNYDYPDDELRELAARIVALARRRAGETHVIFNNNFGDQAQRNGATLIGELEALLPGSTVPAPGGDAPLLQAAAAAEPRMR